MTKLTDDNGTAKPKKARQATSRTKRKLNPRKSQPVTIADFYEPDEDNTGKGVRRSFNTPNNTLNERSREQLLKDMDESRRIGTHVPRYALMITDNATDALLLSQLTYWLTDNRRQLPKPGKGIPCKWAAQTSTELGRHAKPG